MLLESGIGNIIMNGTYKREIKVIILFSNIFMTNLVTTKLVQLVLQVPISPEGSKQILQVHKVGDMALRLERSAEH